jgi:hypothetical protein
MQFLAVFAAAITLAVPGRSNATPTAAADGPFVVVAFSATTAAGTADIFAAVSGDGAKTFGAPVRVNNVEGDARTNGEQPPRVVLSRRQDGPPAVTIVWTTKGTAGTRLVSARSLDGGRSYSPAAAIPDSDAAGNRGWHNLLARRDGSVFAIWLDHREMADHAMAGAPNHEHGPGQKMDGVAMAQQSKLYIGAIDGSVAPHPVTGGVCYCCKTAIAEGANGAIVAAWRHVYPGNFRDIAFTISTDGGRTFAAPARISEDRWMLEGCPDDGPAMVVDGHNTIHIAWPTVVRDEKSGEPTLAIFYTKSTDGRTFAPRTRIPTAGVAHHPQAVLDGHGQPLIAWDESGDGARRIVVASGPSFKRRVIGDGSGVYPSLASAAGGTVAAWTSAQPSGSVIRVAILDAR